MYKNDERIVLTLDAGGTNFVFGAICGNRHVVSPLCLPARPEDLNGCLQTMVDGFEAIRRSLSHPPQAISFAFPGPADYVHGVIGDLPNFPCFRGGVALGAYLENHFDIPVYINNDGNLFAYGEALAGVLPELNRKLEENGSVRRFKNLVGITLGTGFGAGVVINNELLLGDNACGGDVWNLSSSYYPGMIAEEGVSIRAVKRIYGELSGELNPDLTPKDICEIASGTRAGDRRAALESFSRLGHTLGETLATVLTLIDGIVVIGGGLSGAYPYFMPAVMEELNRTLTSYSGQVFPKLQMKVYDMDKPEQLEMLLKPDVKYVGVPGNEGQRVCYSWSKKSGIAISRLGASEAISLGAYAFALNELDKKKKGDEKL